MFFQRLPVSSAYYSLVRCYHRPVSCIIRIHKCVPVSFFECLSRVEGLMPRVAGPKSRVEGNIFFFHVVCSIKISYWVLCRVLICHRPDCFVVFCFLW